MLRKVLGVTAMAAVSVFIALPGAAPATADSGPGAAPASGRLTLYSGSGGGGTPQQFAYSTCPSMITPGLPRVASFHNVPPIGCLATLVNRAGDVYQMCTGRANVPAPFQVSSIVRVVRGTSTRCPV